MAASESAVMLQAWQWPHVNLQADALLGQHNAGSQLCSTHCWSARTVQQDQRFVQNLQDASSKEEWGCVSNGAGMQLEL